MTIIVTANVAARYRGFLASCMLEIAPGVYTAPRMTRGIRDRVWLVLEEWYQEIAGGMILMTWRDKSLRGGQAIRVLGSSPTDLVDVDGLFLARRSGS
jgi:CRISPR-associated protein Cas2